MALNRANKINSQQATRLCIRKRAHLACICAQARRCPAASECAEQGAHLLQCDGQKKAQLFTNCIFEARWKKGSRLHLTVMMTSMLPRVALLYLHFSVSMPPLLRITTAAAHNSRADFMRGVDDLLGVGLLAAREMRFAMRCAHKQRLQQRTLLIPGIFTSSSTARAEGAT
jgi:hypothetical protein